MTNHLPLSISFTSAIALLLACGSDAGSGTPPLTGAMEPAPTVQMPGDGAQAAPPGGQATPDEATNTGLDGAPIASGQPSGNGMPGGESSAPAGTGGSAGEGSGAVNMPAPGASGSPFPADVTRPRIMIIGDSISAGPGCYKGYLLDDLTANGFSRFDFVGEYNDDCGRGVRHSAVSCSTATQYTQPDFTLGANCNNLGPFPGLASLMTEYDPDLLLIQLGVNDVWNGRAIDAILGDYATLVQQARAANPNVVLAVAQIQQISPTGDSGAVFTRAEQLIQALPAWATAQSQASSPVFVADLWTNSNTAETNDGVHPNDAGAQRMGQNWFETLRTILPAN
jgi:GDSL-like lipase/acylhydrolase family protein